MHREFLVLLHVFLSNSVGWVSRQEMILDRHDFSPILQVTKSLHDGGAFLQLISFSTRPSKRLMPIPPPSSVDSSAKEYRQPRPQNFVPDPCQIPLSSLELLNPLPQSFPNLSLQITLVYTIE